MKIFNEIIRTPEFEKDLKKLLKHFRTLDDDLNIFIEKELYLYHKLKIDNKGVFPLTNLPIEIPKIYKAKKFACRSMKGKGVSSGIRVIYAYFPESDKIELIEIYYKGDKANEDRVRVKNYLDSYE
jgi:mRNA-degrading endonuclease RelE of RelBE toxin-antitoxin system